ncbi:MAG: hypothetical protein PHP39_06875, partial [Oscillospiraceae bacterium]|nr:hypothetical protein [Oscillospiraceae bacterium]
MPDSSLVPPPLPADAAPAPDRGSLPLPDDPASVPEPVRPQPAAAERDFQISAEYYADEHQPESEAKPVPPAPLPLPASGWGLFWRRQWNRVKNSRLFSRRP